MKRIKIMLSYNTYPLWVYDKEDILIAPMYPEDIVEDQELIKILDEIQDIYDSLFLNTAHKFSYIGFVEDNERKEFLKKIDIMTNKLIKLIDRKYYIEVSIDI